MRSWLILTALLAISTWLAQVEGAACAAICYTTELTGFGPGGTPGCTCSGSQQGARTGAGGCNCGQCYDKAQGVVYGFAINVDGTCTYGTDCGSCDYSTSSSASSSTGTTTKPATTTPTPTNTPTPTTTTSSTPTSTQTATSSPVPATSAPSSTAAHSSSSSTSSSIDSTSASNSASTDSNKSSSKDNVGNSTSSQAGSEAQGKGMSTWQIVLAICCLVLIFLVAVVSVCACYCKARSRLYEHEDYHTSYYNQHPTFQPWTANNASTGLPIATKSVNIV